MVETIRSKEKSPFLGRLDKIIFVRSADYYDVTEKAIPSSRHQSQFRTPFSMDNFSSVVSGRLRFLKVDLESCFFIDSGNHASRETLRACMYKLGANGEVPKSIPKYSSNPDGPSFNGLFVDQLKKAVHLKGERSICIFVHDKDTHSRLMHSFDRVVQVELWEKGFENLNNPGDILCIKWLEDNVLFEEIKFK